MSQPALASKQFSLAELAKSLSGPDQKYNYFHGKIYSLIAPSLEQVTQLLDAMHSLEGATPKNQPVQRVACRVG